MEAVRIARGEYRSLRQPELATFAEHIVKQTLENPVFNTLQALVVELDALRKQYAAALADTRTGNRQAQVLKEDLRDKLLQHLNLVADAVDKLAAGASTVIVAAGFAVRAAAPRRSGDLVPPEVNNVRSTGRRGEVIVSIRDADPRLVRTHGIEYSVDGGATWNNGKYNSRSRFRHGGLPHNPEMLLRFNAIGTGSAMSEWSEVVQVAVA